jgi:hypothetical protein
MYPWERTCLIRNHRTHTLCKWFLYIMACTRTPFVGLTITEEQWTVFSDDPNREWKTIIWRGIQLVTVTVWPGAMVRVSGVGKTLCLGVKLCRPVPGRHKYVNMAFHVEGISNLRQKNIAMCPGSRTRKRLNWRDQQQLKATDPSSRQRGRSISTNPQLSDRNRNVL